MNIFISHNAKDQKKINELFSKVNHLQRVEKRLSRLEQYSQLTDDFYRESDSQEVFFSVSAVNDNTSELNSFRMMDSSYEGEVVMSYDKLLEQKLEKASQQLVLIDKDSWEIKNLSRVIAEHIEAYNTTDNEDYLYNAVQVLYEYREKHMAEVKKHKRILRDFAGKFFVHINRDLRQVFRAIIRFLFKNMDSDSDDNENLFQYYLKQNSLIQKSYQVYAGKSDVFTPIKGKNASSIIFKRTRADVYPNLFFTEDGIHVRQLTNFEPQKAYNWFTSELVHWSLDDGKKEEGILYKPEDFDPKKRYPVIVYVYERFADALNEYLYPDLSNGTLNIPWYASNGYLVFVPDIKYTIGYPGESAYKTVSSALKYLSRYAWINQKKIGLQGHSFGGYETNYILTRTSKFAAAASAAGVSDLISECAPLFLQTGKHYFYEQKQGRIGSSIWAKPQLYIKNSPIFYADKVSTPILIMHNPLDDTVNPIQGIGWFTALRRLQKKAWLIQYPKESHTILATADQYDFSKKMSEFFDYYLKDKPMPSWMK